MLPTCQEKMCLESLLGPEAWPAGTRRPNAPMAAGQGIVISPCKAAGVIAPVTALGSWMGQGVFQTVPALLVTVGF